MYIHNENEEDKTIPTTYSVYGVRWIKKIMKRSKKKTNAKEMSEKRPFDFLIRSNGIELKDYTYLYVISYT